MLVGDQGTHPDWELMEPQGSQALRGFSQARMGVGQCQLCRLRARLSSCPTLLGPPCLHMEGFTCVVALRFHRTV